MAPSVKGPSTQCLRSLVPKIIQGMVVFGAEAWGTVLRPSGFYFNRQVPSATLLESAVAKMLAGRPRWSAASMGPGMTSSCLASHMTQRVQVPHY